MARLARPAGEPSPRPFRPWQGSDPWHVCFGPQDATRMKALILAAGYATRLRPLTDDRAKSLLPVGGRPMIDWIIDKVDEVDEVDEVHLVTNARFAEAFSCWAPTRNVVVHDDGTLSNEDRLGAIGDIAFVVDRQAWERDDLLVIAGDNLFDFSLADYV